MTFIRDELTGVSTGDAQCDEAGCTRLAPSPQLWMQEHKGERWPGWNKLGWLCAGGRHFCPDHHEHD